LPIITWSNCISIYKARKPCFLKYGLCS